VKGIPVRVPKPKRRIKVADLRYETRSDHDQQNAGHGASVGVRQNDGGRASVLTRGQNDHGQQNAQHEPRDKNDLKDSRA
jgi:hypothetical protein